MQKWEYWSETSAVHLDSADCVNRLNELGEEGWELVSTMPTIVTTGMSEIRGAAFFFKRPKP
jgi:hypothetical protein